MFNEDSHRISDEKQAPKKRYIGDGVYVDFDGYALVLTTENGIEATNTIVLEPSVWSALSEYVKGLR